MENENYIENAAKELCRIRGLDPMELVSTAHPEGFSLAVWVPRWRSVENEVRCHHEVLRAFKAANPSKTTTGEQLARLE